MEWGYTRTGVKLQAYDFGNCVQPAIINSIRLLTTICVYDTVGYNHAFRMRANTDKKVFISNNNVYITSVGYKMYYYLHP